MAVLLHEVLSDLAPSILLLCRAWPPFPKLPHGLRWLLRLQPSGHVPASRMNKWGEEAKGMYQ